MQDRTVKTKYTPADKSLGQTALNLLLQSIDEEIHGQSILSTSYVEQLGFDHGKRCAEIILEYLGFLEAVHLEAKLYDIEVAYMDEEIKIFDIVRELVIACEITTKSLLERISQNQYSVTNYIFPFLLAFDEEVYSTPVWSS